MDGFVLVAFSSRFMPRNKSIPNSDQYGTLSIQVFMNHIPESQAGPARRSICRWQHNRTVYRKNIPVNQRICSIGFYDSACAGGAIVPVENDNGKDDFLPGYCFSGLRRVCFFLHSLNPVSGLIDRPVFILIFLHEISKVSTESE